MARMVKVPASGAAARARTGGPNLPTPRTPTPKGPTAAKAKAILSDGETRGNPLTTAQKGLFGAIAGGAPRQGIGGAATAKRTPPTRMAIGQRPALGARTKSAMMPKVRSRS